MSRHLARHIPAVRFAVVTVVALVASSIAASSASAFHKWGDFHWAKTSSGTFPSPLKLGDNVSTSWDALLEKTSGDWSGKPYSETNPSPVRTVVVPGSTPPKKCAPKSGRVEVCSERYGSTRWLGVAQIWTSGTHIIQATAKMNDTYLSSPAYSAYRTPVMCQEVGHAFGLGHQGENEVDWHTCMDYSAPHAEHSNAPNLHDFSELTGIYNHADSSTTIDGSATATQATKGNVKPYKSDRRDHSGASTIVEHFADNSRKITHIRWVPGTGRSADHAHSHGH